MVARKKPARKLGGMGHHGAGWLSDIWDGVKGVVGPVASGLLGKAVGLGKRRTSGPRLRSKGGSKLVKGSKEAKAYMARVRSFKK